MLEQKIPDLELLWDLFSFPSRIHSLVSFEPGHISLEPLRKDGSYTTRFAREMQPVS